MILPPDKGWESHVSRGASIDLEIRIHEEGTWVFELRVRCALKSSSDPWSAWSTARVVTLSYDSSNGWKLAAWQN